MLPFFITRSKTSFSPIPRLTSLLRPPPQMGNGQSSTSGAAKTISDHDRAVADLKSQMAKLDRLQKQVRLFCCLEEKMRVSGLITSISGTNLVEIKDEH